MYYKRGMENKDIFGFFFEHELNNNNYFVNNEMTNTLIQNNANNLQDKDINDIKNCQIREELIPINTKNHNYLNKKKSNSESQKLRNKESAKRYRERYKLTFSSMLNENKILKEELNNIIAIIKRKKCKCCKNLKLDEQCANMIKQKRKRNLKKDIK